MRSLHGIGVLRGERLAPKGEQVRPPSEIAPIQASAVALDLPGEQKLALVSLCRPFATHLAAEVCKCIESAGVRYPSGSEGAKHWIALAQQGYVIKEGYSLHRVTPKGKGAGIAIMNDLARKYGVHVITYRPKPARSNMGPMASCSCGDWHKSVGRSNSDESRLHRLAGEHLDAVKAGTFKPPRPIEEFLNEYAPLRLPLEAPRQ